MKTLWLTIKTNSDTAFGRGDGLSGVVNFEILQDELGLPYLSGKTLKGLLTFACAEVMSALDGALPAIKMKSWKESAQRLFGSPGSLLKDIGWMHIGDAHCPDDLRQLVAWEIQQSDLSRESVLDALTIIRMQTAMSPRTGAPQKESLRSIRLVKQGLILIARLDFVDRDPEGIDLYLLAACVRALKRAGSFRNRGAGQIEVDIYDQLPDTDEIKPSTPKYFAGFAAEVEK